MSNFSFSIVKKDSKTKARLGILSTPHGSVETPNFIFCGTKGAIKGVTIDQVKNAGAQIVLANTYHLLLRPGGDLVQKMGGLNKMIGWNGPTMTDSGGFQIFSLGQGTVSSEIKGNRSQSVPKTLLSISEEGATFRSYVDGKKHTVTPEISIETQRKIGADLIFAFDECTPFNVSKDYTTQSMRRSHRWELRSLNYFDTYNDGSQVLYGIVQGGIYEDLRKESSEFVSNNNFFGQAIGGSLGGSKSQMHDIVSMTKASLKEDRPTHLLGIGCEDDIIHGVKQGIDTFDCVHPTRIARHGVALVSKNEEKKSKSSAGNILNIRNSQFKDDPLPIDPNCSCYACKNFSRAYIHYLFQAKEMTGGQLLTIHNISYMSSLFEKIRLSIKNNTF